VTDSLPDSHRLIHLIDSEATLMERFVELLEQEEAVLIAGDTDRLLELSQQKSEFYLGLQRHHDSRMLLLARHNLPNDDASIRSLCRTLPDTLARWDELLELARTAKARNETNGKLINERMQHNQAALSILLAATDAPQLYDAEGLVRPAGRGRHLGSA